VGVLILEPEVFCSELNWSKILLRDTLIRLRDDKFISFVKGDSMTFIILEGFAIKKPKGDATLSKYKEILQEYPKKVRDLLGIILSRESRVFKKPTPEEVNKYALEQGYLIQGGAFVSFYDNTSADMGVTDLWYDKRGTQVKDWRAKLRNVWFKPDRKFKIPEGAPKGYEYLYIDYNGNIITPDFWKGGLPKSKEFYLNTLLKDEYKKWQSNS
jgi:hypothetical protein